MDKKHTTVKAGPNGGEDELPAGDPPSLVVLKAVVYIMAVMIVLGVGILVYTLISRASKLEPGISTSEEVGQLVVKAGETVQSISMDRGLVAVHLRANDGSERVVVYSLSRQAIVRQVEVKPQ